MCVIVMILDYIGVNTALCSELMFHSCKAVMIVIEGFHMKACCFSKTYSLQTYM